jgi:hypothetical protein
MMLCFQVFDMNEKLKSLNDNEAKTEARLDQVERIINDLLPWEKNIDWHY